MIETIELSRSMNFFQKDWAKLVRTPNLPESTKICPYCESIQNKINSEDLCLSNLNLDEIMELVQHLLVFRQDDRVHVELLIDDLTDLKQPGVFSYKVQIASPED